MELSFTQLPTPPLCGVFSYLAITYQRVPGAIIHPTPHTPTLWGVLLPCYYIPTGAWSYHSPNSPNPHPVRCSPTMLLHTNRSRELSFTQVPNPHPVRCSPTMLLHTKGSRELSFIQVPKPHAVRCSPTLLLHTKGSMELSFTQLPSPTPWGVLLPCYYIPMGARSYHSHKSLHPHPVRCSATLLIHTNGSMELSFTQVATPSAREVFFYHAITYQREHGAIIHPTPHTPTLWGVLQPFY